MVHTVHVRMPDPFPVLLQETELRLRGPTDHEDVNTYDILITASDRVASVDDPGHTCQVGDAIYIHTIPSTLTQVTNTPCPQSVPHIN